MSPSGDDGIYDGTIVPGEGGRGFGTGRFDGGGFLIAIVIIVATIIAITLLAALVAWISVLVPTAGT